MNFESLDLNDDILDALYDMRFEKCTPIQENCIPEILKGKDVLGVAQTGTGKTAAYLLPVLSKLADGGYPEDAINCLIMSPTRELAQQIDQAIQGFSYYLNGVSCVAVYGGNDGNRYDQELKSLSLGADLVIATPGRFISHMSLGNVDLSKVSFFILDEADRMLDMGFSEDIMTIQKNLPKTCQTIMFSATMPKKIEDLAQTLLTNPSVIKLAVSKPAEKIHQLAYVCHETQKMGIIKDIFKAGNLQRVIIFSGSKQKVKQIALSLNQKKINCGQMHSDLAQAERDEMMFKFKSGQIDVLVATDILARGIDIDDIAMVINYDVPHDAEDYVHRIGRTARADRKGSAITFVNEDDIYYFQQIENFLEKEVEKAELPEGLGEGLDYVSRNKERRKTSAKSRRRKDRDQQSHKDKKVRNNRRNNNQPTATNETKKQDVKTKKVQDGKNEPAKSYKKNNNRKQRPTNFNGEVVETTDKQTPKKRQNRVQKDNKDSKTDKKQPQTVAETTNNKPKKKRPKKKKQPSFEANDTQRSSKYDMSEYFPKPKKEESGLKKLIKKPLKWLSNLGKK
ncbi:DEAD/DEAH box helicase [Prevotella disiens]|uniref:DEAD/DEAH box helicase n=1 Tax=Prevotella disiens TaxID=28130 RepID=UPI0028896E8C|nr:DEAD/DEAH box helicase [Prevotella disiens]